jgi:hypothetical protein
VAGEAMVTMATRCGLQGEQLLLSDAVEITCLPDLICYLKTTGMAEFGLPVSRSFLVFLDAV